MLSMSTLHFLYVKSSIKVVDRCISIILLSQSHKLTQMSHPFMKSSHTINHHSPVIFHPNLHHKNMSFSRKFNFCSMFIQLYQARDKSTRMHFLANLFSCNPTTRSKTNTNCLSALCSKTNQKKHTKMEKPKAKEDSATLRTMSNSSRPASTMDRVTPRTLPQPSFLHLRGCFNRSEKEINWGFLVGMVGCQLEHEKLITPSTVRVRIGRNQQITSLISMRRNSLDKLLVFWSQLSQEFPINQLIRCRQPLVLLVQQWQLLLRLVKVIQEELLKSLGEFCLLQSSNSIFFNIITYENKFAIQFEESNVFKIHAKNALENNLKERIAEEDLQHLLEKMTLNDYVQMRKEPEVIGRKMRHYLAEIQREKMEKERMIATAEPQESVLRHQSEQLSQEQIYRIRKDSKSSDAELQAAYFAQRRKEGAQAPFQDNPIHEEDNLLIYYFNNEDRQQQFQMVLPARPTNLVRKMRSKSEDATYIPDGTMELDDEFFQKYQ